ncbi:hypothetical protein [Actinoplanes sp. NBC_00393]|uniref:hypothetical protein n=1 Tax=Actinoplanes sp. NBC_00393 TaxID=2975953 RepID=UPI003FA46D11
MGRTTRPLTDETAAATGHDGHMSENETSQARNFLSYRSSGSVLSVCSKDSVLSIGCVGSILSVGSFGSVLSVGSVASFGSVLSVGSFGSLFAVGVFGSVLTTGSPALSAAVVLAVTLAVFLISRPTDRRASRTA